MKAEEIQITTGENQFQTAGFEKNNETIDYETSKNLSFSDIISITNGLNVISEFYDVKAATVVTPIGICAVALAKTIEEAIMSAMDANPIDFLSSVVVVSDEINSDTAKMLKFAHLIAAPKFTKNAEDYLEGHDISYVTIKTPLNEYKKYLKNSVTNTPLGTLIQAPNTAELNKDSFKVVTKEKPTAELIEDAVFAWKVAKHANSRAIVIAKDLKTTAIAQGLQAASIEYALDFACDGSKEAVLASDMTLTPHDIDVAAQGRIKLAILPSAEEELITLADKYNMSIITTGFSNISY